MEIRWGPRGIQSFDIQGVHPRLLILPQIYCQVSANCKRPKSIERGYKFLIMDIIFWKNFWRLFSLITFSSAVTQSYQAFKYFRFTQKYQTQQKVWPQNIGWMPLECILSNFDSQGREDAAKQFKRLLGMSWVSPLSSWCIASLYIYHFSYVIDFSSEKWEMINI